jgi:hypothetical protein
VALRSSSSQVLPATVSGLSMATQSVLQSATAIVGGGEAEIGMGEAQPEAAVGKPQRLGRAVARIIVDDDRLEVGKALRGERVDAILQQWAGIVIDDDHAHPGRGTLNHLALHQLPLAYSLQE